MTPVASSPQQLVTKMREAGIRTVIFDLDGTVARTNITMLYFYMKQQEFTSRSAYRIWKAAIDAAYGPWHRLLDKIDRTRFQQRFFRWYANYPLSALERHARELVEESGDAIWISPVHELLELIQDAGLYVEIHSSNMHPFVKAFACHLDIPCRAVPAVDINGRCRIDTSSIRHFKARQLEDFELEKTAMVADAASDPEAFRMVGFPIVVSEQNPTWRNLSDYWWLRPSGQQVAGNA